VSGVRRLANNSRQNVALYRREFEDRREFFFDNEKSFVRFALIYHHVFIADDFILFLNGPMLRDGIANVPNQSLSTAEPRHDAVVFPVVVHLLKNMIQS